MLRTNAAEGGEPGFRAGVLPGGRQALLGQYGPKLLLCIRFDADGALAGCEARSLEAPTGETEQGHELRLTLAAEQSAAWRREFG